MAFERLRIPTVTVTATGFHAGLQSQAKFSGLTDALPTALVPAPLTNSTAAEIERYIDAAFEDLVGALTGGAGSEKEKAEGQPRLITFRGADAWGLFESMNQTFLKYNVSDGFPIIPPTEDRVRKMLETTKEPPETEIGILEPGKGSATIEKIAINAVMAGCEPAHFPVVLAATRALADPRLHLWIVGQSTTAHALLLIVNGPIAKKLGMNSGSCALGPGAPSQVNLVIGRAVRLVLMNVAFQYPGVTDLDYLGSGNKLSMCFAEDEDANPWEPLHVELGYSRDTSTVSVLSTDGQMEARAATSDPEPILRALAAAVGSPSTTSAEHWMNLEAAGNPLIVLSETHAKNLADQGWTKADVKQFLYQHARAPAYFFKYCGTRRGDQLPPAWQWLNDAPDDTLVPTAISPDAYQIVVVGAPAPKSTAFPVFTSMVTVPIEDSLERI